MTARGPAAGAKALDALPDTIEPFTRATVSTEVRAPAQRTTSRSGNAQRFSKYGSVGPYRRK
ncbi:MAG: hypothetical protein RJA99_4005 [Pseudomonadota bacterium]|jgi:hypothetical protein